MKLLFFVFFSFNVFLLSCENSNFFKKNSFDQSNDQSEKEYFFIRNSFYDLYLNGSKAKNQKNNFNLIEKLFYFSNFFRNIKKINRDSLDNFCEKLEIKKPIIVYQQFLILFSSISPFSDTYNKNYESDLFCFRKLLIKNNKLSVPKINFLKLLQKNKNENELKEQEIENFEKFICEKYKLILNKKSNCEFYNLAVEINLFDNENCRIILSPQKYFFDSCKKNFVAQIFFFEGDETSKVINNMIINQIFIFKANEKKIFEIEFDEKSGIIKFIFN